LRDPSLARIARHGDIVTVRSIDERISKIRPSVLLNAVCRADAAR